MDGDAGTKAGAHPSARCRPARQRRAREEREESSKAQAHTKTAYDDAWSRGHRCPVFLWLLGAVNLFSLFRHVVLVAQKHGDELNTHRDIRTLELAILSEQQIAKVI
jgi:hypothetical protein